MRQLGASYAISKATNNDLRNTVARQDAAADSLQAQLAAALAKYKSLAADNLQQQEASQATAEQLASSESARHILKIRRVICPELQLHMQFE